MGAVHSADTTAHTFIVRLWMEDFEAPGLRRWRGYVTHLIDDERSYVDGIDDIVEFIGRYLVTNGDAARPPVDLPPRGKP